VGATGRATITLDIVQTNTLEKAGELEFQELGRNPRGWSDHARKTPGGGFQKGNGNCLGVRLEATKLGGRVCENGQKLPSLGSRARMDNDAKRKRRKNMFQ